MDNKTVTDAIMDRMAHSFKRLAQAPESSYLIEQFDHKYGVVPTSMMSIRPETSNRHQIQYAYFFAERTL
ncbi:Hypothetical protein HEAR1547 [Herminiimonas arsenicoxydans]|uniref:Uncharacterized protein n=1 Tax=Herminiimonas arsenicoxydans TaxID=204773 RepID=A4G5C4_HERAR|nr:Hypothetical protein HEAR1547 [Herminiimonas arsenicoxydans]